MPLKSGPLPTFADIELSNHTARVGNEVSFGCTVKNLGNYKVEYPPILLSIKHTWLDKSFLLHISIQSHNACGGSK